MAFDFYKFKKFTESWKKIIKKPYYYVPPCPECGSHITGRYVMGYNSYEYEWMINESLRNGEIISVILVEQENNAYCVECDHEWKCNIPLKMHSIADIERQKSERHTGEILQMRYEKIKEEEKNRGPIRKFIGHL